MSTHKQGHSNSVLGGVTSVAHAAFSHRNLKNVIENNNRLE